MDGLGSDQTETEGVRSSNVWYYHTMISKETELRVWYRLRRWEKRQSLLSKSVKLVVNCVG